MFGLDARPANSGCVATQRPPGEGPITVADNLEPFPQWLSETGCMDPDNPREPAPGLIPYETAHQFWSDGADKQRWLALPEGERIVIGDDGVWALPVGSVVVKQFAVAGDVVETRLYMHHADGWAGYSYGWNAARTDAEYNSTGRIVSTQSGQGWPIPSSLQCVQCHTAAAGRTLGLRTEQLAGELYYPSTGRVAQQLATLTNIGLFENPPSTPMDVEALPSRSSSSASTEELARAYLDVNCASCHRPDSEFQGRSEFDARRTTPLADMGLCNVEPRIASFGIDGAQLVAPGAPDLSIVVNRMVRRDFNGMPPAGSLAADPLGLDAVEAWIASLDDCE